MCKVNPDNIAFLQTFATVFIVGGILSLITNITYFRRLVYRDQEPVLFWLNVFSLFGLGLFVFIGIFVCK